MYLIYSTCDDSFDNSSINCSSESVYSYTNETIHNHATKLFIMLSNITNGSFCMEMLGRFLCSIIYPPFDQSSGSIQTICPGSCQNYVSNGICAIHVEAMVQVLRRNNLDDIASNLYNCSSPLLQPSNNISLGCYNLTGNKLSTLY